MPGMPHLHEKIDFTVAIFVVHEGRVLVIHYRKLDKWLPLGGHIELDEDPEQAALREAREEHHDIRWCTAAALEALQPPMSNAVKWYCRKAIEEMGGA